jgi:hypothetical protein
MGNLIYIWKKALGEKAHDNNKVADKVALVRSVIVLTYLVTNITIVIGIIHHW